MKQTLLIGFLAFASISVYGQEKDSSAMHNIIDVDVVGAGNDEQTTKHVIPERIEKLEEEKDVVVEKISDYKQTLRFKRKKELLLSSTGYYKPSITLGLTDLKRESDYFCSKVDEEISSLLAYDIDYNITTGYIRQLEQLQTQVQSEYEKVPDMLRRKIQ